MTRITRIYALRDPRTNEVRYVGKTVQALRERLLAHIRRSGECKTHRDCWIHGLKNSGLTPTIETIELVDGPNWAQREIFWIAHFRSSGSKLTNQTIGGEGIDAESLSATWTQERRARQSQLTAERNRARAGIGWTEERREQQRLVRKKSWENPERRARMSEAMKVVAADPVYRNLMSESCRNSWTPERRRMQSEVAKRVNADPERKRRQSEMMRNRNKNRDGQIASFEHKAIEPQGIES
jgi:hypothetical protein